MNTTELVRFVERAEARIKPRRHAAPLFYTELAAPTRQAILRARQDLLSEQRDDGSWVGAQSGDASLASQLIVLLAYFGDERSPRAQQAAATILDLQLPDGGWSLEPNAKANVSVSVQSYFALKLSGMDPTDERMSRARQAIRELGGADAADGETRYVLALFSQISFDQCDPASPESALLRGNIGAKQAALSIIWSHRPAREIGVECGARELFVNRPETWQKANPTRNPVHALLACIGRYCERRGWTPLRRRDLDRAEAILRERTSQPNVRSLDFSSLVWCMITLHAAGLPDDSDFMRGCDARLEELVQVDEKQDRAIPQPRTTPMPDTLLALQALRSSGVAADHPCVMAAVRFLSRSRRPSMPLALCDVAQLLRLLTTATNVDSNSAGALPPEIQIGGRRGRADQRSSATRFANRVRPLVASLVERLLNEQRRDGSWGDVEITANVLEAIGLAGCECSQPALGRAAEHLRNMQRADGSWADETGTPSVHSTSLAIRGLISAGVAADDEPIAAGINWLAVHQSPCGGWGEPASPTHAAAALEAFVAAERPHHATALRAARFLVDSQHEHGGWLERGLVSRDPADGRWFCNELHASTGPLLALSQWAVAAASAQPAATILPSLRLIGAAADN